jgi:hypothetical protein
MARWSPCSRLKGNQPTNSTAAGAEKKRGPRNRRPEGRMWRWSKVGAALVLSWKTTADLARDYWPGCGACDVVFGRWISFVTLYPNYRVQRFLIRPRPYCKTSTPLTPLPASWNHVNLQSLHEAAVSPSCKTRWLIKCIDDTLLLSKYNCIIMLSFMSWLLHFRIAEVEKSIESSYL